MSKIERALDKLDSIGFGKFFVIAILIGITIAATQIIITSVLDYFSGSCFV